MFTIISDSLPEIRIPAYVVDLSTFRRWYHSDEFPEEGRICFLKGEVWIDMSGEQIFTHVLVKTEITAVLAAIVKNEALGLFLADGAQLANVPGDISVKPDATFIATDTLQSGRVQLIEGAEEGYVELEGAPDMVLEVVSKSSVRKDTVVLPQAYDEAGIREYWLVDARRTPVRFDIYSRQARGFVPVRKPGGWLKSQVYGKSFRLVQKVGAAGHPDFTLEVR